MSGPSYAPILIPIAGTIFLLAWLALVFYAGRDHPPRAGHNPAPGRQSPGTAHARPRGQAGSPSVWLFTHVARSSRARSGPGLWPGPRRQARWGGRSPGSNGAAHARPAERDVKHR
jgi:hypothetical protein